MQGISLAQLWDGQGKAHPEVDEKGSPAPSLLLLATAPKHGKCVIFAYMAHKHDKHGIFYVLNNSHFATITPQEQNFPFLLLLGTLPLHKSTAGLFVSQGFQSKFSFVFVLNKNQRFLEEP